MINVNDMKTDLSNMFRKISGYGDSCGKMTRLVLSAISCLLSIICFFICRPLIIVAIRWVLLPSLILLTYILGAMSAASRLSLDNLLKELKRAGVCPYVLNDELGWMLAGRENRLRIIDGVGVSIRREYPISDEALPACRRSAMDVSATSSPVKAYVKTDGKGTNKLVFVASAYCRSARMFRASLGGYLAAMDAAEASHRLCYDRALAAQSAAPARKIGFNCR